MDDSRWERAAWAGGILFVVITLVGGFLPGSPPKTGDSAVSIARFFADNERAIRWGSFLALFATIPFVWWGASAFRMMQRGAGSPRLAVIGVVGLSLAAAGGALNAVLMAAIAIAGPAGSGGVNGTRFFYLFANNMLAVTMIGIALLVGAISAVILRSGIMAKAIGWFGALVALAAVAASTIMATTRDAAFDLMFVAFMGVSLFIIIVSVVMLRRPSSEETRAPAAAAA